MLAKALNAEILSADARQFYRSMDVGTAKPTAKQLSEVPHHFIDILDPSEEYSAGQFERDGIDFLSTYFKSKEVCLLVGGSGMYINAITEGFDDLPKSTPAVRAMLSDLYREKGLAHMQNLLEKADPAYFKEVDLNNVQRVQRALEAIEMTGIPFSQLRTNSSQKRAFRIEKILIQPPREMLYKRINDRADDMLKKGLMDEVKSLYHLKNQNALKTVGYQELFDFMDGKCSLDDAIDKIKQHSRNYAKRQITWFKKQREYRVFETNEFDPVIRHLAERLNV